MSIFRESQAEVLAVGVVCVSAEGFADAAVREDSVGRIGRFVQEGDLFEVGVRRALFVEEEGQGVAFLAEVEFHRREDHGERRRQPRRHKEEDDE